MTDENKEKINNKNWCGKMLHLKQNYIRKIVLLIFIVCIFTCG